MIEPLAIASRNQELDVQALEGFGISVIDDCGHGAFRKGSTGGQI
jgi:hypothetical protein